MGENGEKMIQEISNNDKCKITKICEFLVF